jgi:membrane protein insertase Oxa1/YidC/SpoIIIJ
MEFTLPLMTIFFAYNMSGAIGIYWLFQNVLSLIERFFISIVMPLPKYTEEEIKQIQKAMKKDAPAPAARPERKDGEKPRSLHRIDEDDDDVPAPAPKKKSEAKPEEKAEASEPTKEEQKNAAIADKVIGEAPALKDESDKYNRKKK